MEENKKCISFLPFISNTSSSSVKGAMDNCIDATYIIHLENNGRMESIQKQLEVFRPSTNIFIVVNKGFKKCEKSLPKQLPHHDLVDTYLQIFKHADKVGKYQGNILILEDDFIWSTEMNHLNVSSVSSVSSISSISSVSSFINSRKDEEIAYHLGVIPILHIPVDFQNNYLMISMGCHSVIYTKPLQQKILNTDVSLIKDWDVFLNLYITRYYYYIPLCYQLFPETDNQKYWGTEYPFLHSMSLFGILLLKFLEMDKKTEPGFAFFYYLSILLFYICVFLVVSFLLFVIHYTHNHTK